MHLYFQFCKRKKQRFVLLCQVQCVKHYFVQILTCLLHSQSIFVLINVIFYKMIYEARMTWFVKNKNPIHVVSVKLKNLL